MIYLIYEKETGLVVSHLIRDQEPEVMSHHATVVVDVLPKYEMVRVVDGEVTPYAREGLLDAKKEKRIKDIENARDDHIASGVDTPWGVFQADPISRTNINGAVNLALLNRDQFTITWRTADNEPVTLDGEAMISVGVLVGQFVGVAYSRSWELKSQVREAASFDELDLIVISFPES